MATTTRKRKPDDQQQPPPSRQAEQPAPPAPAEAADTAAVPAAAEPAAEVTALSPRPRDGGGVAPPVPGAMTQRQADLIRRTICAGASDDELQLFLMQCQRTGLDPFSRQIHAVKRRVKDDQGRWGERLTIQVGIDGLRLIADRTGRTDGQDGPLWCGPDGQWRDVWLEQEPPAACKVVVYRKGQARGYAGVALFREFCQPGPMWQRMPSVMLAKVAESIALRKAFPAELSGLYAPEELREDGGGAQVVPAAADAPKQQQPAPQAAAAPADWHVKLQAFDQKLAEDGLCRLGDLVKCVAGNGRHNGYPADFTAWDEGMVGAAREWAEDFRLRMQLHQDVDRLMALKGATIAQVLGKLKVGTSTGLMQLDAGQLRFAIARLEEMPDRAPAKAG